MQTKAAPYLIWLPVYKLNLKQNAYQVELNTWATKEGPMPLQQTKGEINTIPPHNQDWTQKSSSKP